MNTYNKIEKEIDNKIDRVKTLHLQDAAVEVRLMQAYTAAKDIVKKHYDSTMYQDKLKEMFPDKGLDAMLCESRGTIIISFNCLCESVSDGFLTGVSGEGKCVEDACESLYNDILGKTLRFTDNNGNKTEVKIITA